MPNRRPLSRREFLQGVAVSSLAGPALIKAASGRRVIVVGAGAFGSWTATHLQRMGARVTLLDAWGPGNSRASSGGVTRVIRSIYGPDRIYTEMVARSFELWEELQAQLGRHLYVETGALWMLPGENDYVRAALPICRELGFPIDELSPSEAARRWPQISFDGVRTLYFERRAGALSARRSCQVLRDRFVRAGGQYQTAQAAALESGGGDKAVIRLSDGASLEAEAAVFACGPWLGQLFPEIIGNRVAPTRQDVLYFGVPGGNDQFRSGRFPTWIDFGERIYYGLPDMHGHGIKLADDTRGDSVDPTRLDRTPDAQAVARAKAFLARRFPNLADAPLVESRVCQYENSPDGHLILDRHPEADNVWLAGGGSGHGFKLSPTVGEMLAHAVIDDRPLPSSFGLARLGDDRPRATQFESGSAS